MRTSEEIAAYLRARYAMLVKVGRCVDCKHRAKRGRVRCVCCLVGRRLRQRAQRRRLWERVYELTES